jgi:hypothetical protein
MDGSQSGSYVSHRRIEGPEPVVSSLKILNHMFMPHNKALQLTRINVDRFPWLFVRAAELGR